MLRDNTNFVKAGVIKLLDDFFPVYCDIETGDVVFENYNDGTIIQISEISVDNPMEMLTVERLEDGIEREIYGENVIGIILKEDMNCVVILSDDKAEVRSTLDPAKSTNNAFDICMSMEYEMSEASDGVTYVDED